MDHRVQVQVQPGIELINIMSTSCPFVQSRVCLFLLLLPLLVSKSNPSSSFIVAICDSLFRPRSRTNYTLTYLLAIRSGLWSGRLFSVSFSGEKEAALLSMKVITVSGKFYANYSAIRNWVSMSLNCRRRRDEGKRRKKEWRNILMHIKRCFRELIIKAL